MDNLVMADAGDRMFCHSCGGVWLKDAANGLNCPHCQSDFTEIIEIPPDTEEPSPPSLPRDEHAQPQINPWVDHNPWAGEEDHNDHEFPWRPGYSRRTYRSPDGQWTFTTSTTTLGGGGFTAGQPMNRPRQAQIDPLMPVVRSLDAIFQGLAETYRHGQNVDQNRNRGGVDLEDETDPDARRARDESPEFRATGRLFPRDAEGPQPMAAPLGTLGDILELFRTDFGGNATGGGVRVMTGPNPLAMLSTLLNFDRHGDAVYSQEELDRVISQLIDQNINRAGAPPAPESAIQSLPKKKVDEEMLGTEGKAECSICMDPVEKGTEVTVLPCKHWFHYPCIEAWLIQHNTCPHCRRGIDTSRQEEGTSENPVVINDSPGPISPERRRSSAQPQNGGQPPAWSEQPWNTPQGHTSGASEQDQQHSSHSDGSGGFAGWVRSRFGGSQS